MSDKTMCRLCMSTKNVATSLFRGGNGEQLAEFILHVFRIQIHEKKRWPASICRRCAIQINGIKVFRKKISTTQVELRNIFPEEDEADCKESTNEPIQWISGESDLQEDLEESTTELLDMEIPLLVTDVDGDDVESPGPSSETTGNKDNKAKLPRKREKSGETLAICEICGHTFRDRFLYRMHKLKHIPIEDRPKYHCPICDKVLYSKAKLSQHKNRMHKRSEAGECPICHKKYIRLKEHMHFQHDVGGKLLRKPCHICGKEFKFYSLKSHLRTHQLPSIPCPECGKMFITKEAVKRHLVIHTGERSKCWFCPHSALGMDNSRNHMRKAHPVEYEQAKADRAAAARSSPS